MRRSEFHPDNVSTLLGKRHEKLRNESVEESHSFRKNIKGIQPSIPEKLNRENVDIIEESTSSTFELQNSQHKKLQNQPEQLMQTIDNTLTNNLFHLLLEK